MKQWFLKKFFSEQDLFAAFMDKSGIKNEIMARIDLDKPKRTRVSKKTTTRKAKSE